MNIMKLKYINTYLLLIFIIPATLFSSCNEDLNIGEVELEKYGIQSENLSYLVSKNNRLNNSLIELRTKDSTSIFLETTQKTTNNIKANLVYAVDEFENYNKSNGGNYKAFPESLIEFDNNINIAKGASRSEALNIKISSDTTLETGSTYIIPLKVENLQGETKLSESSSTHFIFVKDLTNFPSTLKANGIRVVSCMEINDTNPLANLAFTLKSNGKPLIDMVVLFANNMIFNHEEKRMIIKQNNNIQYCLDNKEKYIKPLQDRGIKVIMGILSGRLGQLPKENAIRFAKETKAYVDAFGLDGVFLDEEYGNNNFPAEVGFVNAAKANSARVAYEMKQAMPEKDIIAYAYGAYYGLPEVDGVQSGDYIDYALHDYGRGSDLSSDFPGMTKDRMGLYSQEFRRGYFASEGNLEFIRDNGYKMHMIFAMKIDDDGFESRQLPALEKIASKFYDDEVVWDGKKYKKDW
jgi:hypothetical protein